jgi:hypothetical protein
MAKQEKSKYAGVSGAKAQRVGNYVKPGHYLARIDRVEEGQAFKKGPFIAVQFTIVHAFENSVPGFDYNRKVALALHRAGEDVTDICMLSNVAFESRVKAIALVAGGLTESDFVQEEYPGKIIEDMVDEDQPLAGVVVEIRADTVVKKVAKAKPEEALTNDDVYTRLGYMRRVPASELAEILEDRELQKFFPDLEEQLAEEAAIAEGE